MYPRNAASPPRLALGAVVQISDGVVQTSAVSIKVRPEGGTASAGGGTTAYEEGIVLYTPTQAETDYTAFVVIAYKTGCVPVSLAVVTTANATPGTVNVGTSGLTAASLDATVQARLGIVAYGTYDLTNLATLKGWPVGLTFFDMAWGACLSVAVASWSYIVATRVLNLG